MLLPIVYDDGVVLKCDQYHKKYAYNNAFSLLSFSYFFNPLNAIFPDKRKTWLSISFRRYTRDLILLIRSAIYIILLFSFFKILSK